ncbi:hypothetical protein VOLCADRAFT_90500 [Volvox carteri f. nagariensis]|uniref:Protein kinase domain-containing protein n=1 Tax=Volvox carteri f. nagariensis TaxID=3068 RepID=D8TUJ7_VOLCA|nr:uncharacterized protein VOLCADRAFT_90500 [Volvox carteri f. nagariensis]EFJ48835.1 hypothetical protein VOLCADRAFT_90500 [Volvox carteri f. nagariensis]|eukprot:XP_002950167.1 hypothetical protein VOLCADRAFT_90500 [Volvox carteri f. nagariensis]
MQFSCVQWRYQQESPPQPLNLTRMDFSYLAAKIQLAAGVALRLQGLEVWRALTRISAHLDFMAVSRGALVTLEATSAAYRESKEEEAVAAVLSVAVVVMVVVVGDVSYLTQVLDSALANNGGYTIRCWGLMAGGTQSGWGVETLRAGLRVTCRGGRYVNSYMACDWTVGPDCVAQRGAERVGFEVAVTATAVASAVRHLQHQCRTERVKPVRQVLVQRVLEPVEAFLQEPERVEAVRRQLAASRQAVSVQVLGLIGHGSFARVYKGIWQGHVVALKVLILPACLTRDERLQHIAVMEAAVSSALSHPNLVQTYSYSFRAIMDSTLGTSSSATSANDQQNASTGGGGAAGNGNGNDGGGGGKRSVTVSTVPTTTRSRRTAEECEAHGYELQLVLEYCDLGTLRQALDRGAFHRNLAAGAYLGGGGGGDDGREGGGGGGGRPSCGTTDSSISTAAYGHGPPPSALQGTIEPGGGGGPGGDTTAAAAAPAAGLQQPLGAENSFQGTTMWFRDAPVGAGGGSGGGGGTTSSPATGVPAPSVVAAPSSFEQLLDTGVVAKVSDFGLSTHVDDRLETHVSAVTAQGTLTHMSPELMLYGHISRHQDTYAFGIMLYELFTGERATAGCPGRCYRTRWRFGACVPCSRLTRHPTTGIWRSDAGKPTPRRGT